MMLMFPVMSLPWITWSVLTVIEPDGKALAEDWPAPMSALLPAQPTLRQQFTAGDLIHRLLTICRFSFSFGFKLSSMLRASKR